MHGQVTNIEPMGIIRPVFTGWRTVLCPKNSIGEFKALATFRENEPLASSLLDTPADS